MVVREGTLIHQLFHPTDPVGNPTAEIPGDRKGMVYFEEVGQGTKHPITRIDYVTFCRDLIAQEGATTLIFFSNDPRQFGTFPWTL